MRFLRSFFIIFMGFLPVSAMAEPCDVLRNLAKLYLSMEEAHENGGRLSSDRSRDLLVRGHQITIGQALIAMENTGLGAEVSRALRPLRSLQLTTITRAGSDVIVTGLTNPRHVTDIHRALAVLERSDCPAPPINRMEQMLDFGSQVYFNLTGGSTTSQRSSGNRDLSTLAAFGAAGFAGVGVALMVFLVIRRLDKIMRLKRRHTCLLPVQVCRSQDEDGEGIWEQATAIDISREGVKLALTSESRLADGTTFKLRMGGTEFTCRTHWINQQFLGGEFAKPLTKAQIDPVLALNKMLEKRRAKMPNGAPKDAVSAT